ncbi:MAG TPA: PAS domain S-box protein [Acidimicrobiia bacterium]|nr:PAS domain S-box protein [Acidimicrobiia bacterium]
MGPGLWAAVVVDDADDVRAVVGRQLRLSGQFSIVGEGRTGSEAVALAATHRPAVMVLDASMPDMDGLEALPGILEASPETRVVMLSGFGGHALEVAARAVGAADFVEKGAPLRELPARLLRLLGDVPEEPLPVGTVPSERETRAGAESEEVFAQHLERFRTVFDQAAIGMATMTLAGTVVRVNAALVELTGRPAGALIGRRYTGIAAPESRPELDGTVHRLAHGEIDAAEVEHRLAGEEAHWARSTLVAVADTDGQPLYLFTQTEDITVRRRALEELRASEERFRLLVEAVQDYAIFMLDRDGYVSTWNAGAERMKGYKAEEIIGRHFRNFYPPEKQEIGHPEHELELAVRDGHYEEEGWRIRKDGTRFWANVVITALFDSEGRLAGFGKVTRDVTERRRTEEARDGAAAILAEANEQLRIAREDAVNALDITAHELRSPIAALTGAADIMAEHWDRLDPEERAESLRNVSRSAARARRLLDDLLIASRLEVGSMEFQVGVVPVGAAVREALTAIGPKAAAVEVTGAEDLTVKADRTRLVQMVTNLVSNAFRYGEPPVTVDVRPNAEMVEVAVCDRGRGVPEDLEPRLFRKFVRGQGRPDRGTGLGLFIVAEMARRQGGAAWYERRPGQSCFAFRLPRA